MLACNPQHNHEDEEADDMNNHEYAFRHRQLSCTEDVKTRCSNEEQHNEQRSLPQRIHTRIWIPQQHQSLHQRRRKLRSRRTSRDPSQGATPSYPARQLRHLGTASPLLTNEIAKLLLRRPGCEFRNPMILATSRRGPNPHKPSIRLFSPTTSQYPIRRKEEKKSH